ncbi:hypothetical protein ACFL5N_02880, partial [bacterium]
FTGSASFGITVSSITDWNTAYGWGDHSLAGYLTSYTETDPVWTSAEPNYANLGQAETIIGNWVNTTNPWSDNEVSALSSGVQGDILYHNGSVWTQLSVGTSGQFLQTQGVGANPQWALVAGSGDNLGNHTATQDLNMSNYNIVNVSTLTASERVTANTFVGDGSGLTNLPAETDPVWVLAEPNYANLGQAETIIGNWVNTTNPWADNEVSALSLGIQGDILYHNGTIWTQLSVGTSGQFLQTQGAGTNPQWATVTVSGDNLGNHTATQNLNMSSYNITNVSTITATIGNFNKVYVSSIVGTSPIYAQTENMVVSGSVTANAFVGDGSGLSNVPGDNLGNHTATQNLDMLSNDIINVNSMTAGFFVGDGSGLTNLSSLWTQTGSDIYYNTGNVGIGIAGPTYPLHVDQSTNNYNIYNTNLYSGALPKYGIYNQLDSGGTGSKYGIRNTVTINPGSFTSQYGYSGTVNMNNSAETLYGLRIDMLGSGLGTTYAGYFTGNVHVQGNLSKSGGGFKIDHPLDPENKYLSHSFVESPDMMNIYNGNIVTNGKGIAVVELPEYFTTLNKDFRYQLTVIGKFAQAIILEEVNQNNRFKIKTNKPNVKVSWQVTGIRQDPVAEQNRIIVEEEKRLEDRGKYLNPEAYGRPASDGIHYNEDV